MNISKISFGKLSNGRLVYAYELTNSGGAAVKILTYGARVSSWIYNGVNIVLGYDNIKAYERDEAYLGAVVGRCANRIGGAKFQLNGKTYILDRNDGNNHLHGGFSGFERKIWQAATSAKGLELSVESADGEGGYPGNFKATVTYFLTDENELVIDYAATADADTLCNLTNHTYFNLDGFGSGSVLNQKIQINADSYTWANAESIPDGRILPVSGTPMDLRALTAIGEHIDDDFDQLNFGHGYDHNFCVGRLGEMKEVARAESAKTGIALTVSTTQPGLQFYTGNFLDDKAEITRRSGFALETQFFPNAINRPAFDKPVLRKAEVQTSRTIYKVSI